MPHATSPVGELLLDPERRPVIAHRGASARAPENTLASFALALELGADAVEFDVHVTADDVPVVIHDPTLDRTTDLSGAVAALTLDQLRRADAGARFSPDGGRTFPFRGRGLTVPTLAEVLEAVPEHPLIIEVKARQAQSALRRVLLEHGAASCALLASFDDAALQAFREPPFLVGGSRTDAMRFWIASLLRGRPVPTCRALFIPERYRGLTVASPRLVRSARAAGCPVHVWTVNDPAAARRLWSSGVSGIVTNVTDVMLAARAGVQ